MSTKKETTPNYNPSRDELNDVISLVLKREVRTVNGDLPCDRIADRDDVEGQAVAPSTT